ncbi:hypothetical protein Ccar_05400 [Clostridium carboxidivorans P7]|uniref:DUF1287 domain-containing protein n=1 Tax=Clostridium carboxidivorans P7 TaxID=536227 RepID=C6PSU1_9CLOT|nr:DUF1287 domain-containing protein [Clostridium carboxidivorans]AKN30288.1 hypothetical protein Ccar_05400 [Clostridium carboxidivorans P7]EET87680.1 protein of unknown function DUF1287 [Clostridium carboxidivorans P7]
MRKKFFIIFLIFICLSIIGFKFWAQKSAFYSKNTKEVQTKSTTSEKKQETINEKLKKEIAVINSDKDKSVIKNREAIVVGARKEAEKKVKYKSEYYVGGYPPDNEGVCTDLVWRAFKDAGYNLKDMVDEDIRNHPGDYKRIEGKPDPNIDFRRVPNLYVYFKKYATSITTELKPNDIKNLKEWQPGDIITFDHSEHIAIVSDKRRTDGVPYIIHNAPPYAREGDEIMYWMPRITGHFRFPK